MDKVLDCTNIQTTYESLQNILDVTLGELNEFISQNIYRFSQHSKYGYYNFDRLNIETIKTYFSRYEFNLTSVIVHHASAIIDSRSFLDQGIYNLKGLAETHDNTFKTFLKDYKIRFEINKNNGQPYFEYQGKTVSTDYIQHRLSRDQCINGFLFSHSLLEDTNIEELKHCPEIIAHLGRHLGIDLRGNWIKRSTPSMVSFKVNIERLDKSTFSGQELNFKEKQEYFIKVALENLLIFDAVMYQYPKDNPMIFLNEDIQIGPEDIVNSIPLIDI